MFIIMLFQLVISAIGFQTVSRYKVSEDSKIELFYLLLPFWKKNPRIAYLIHAVVVFFLIHSLDLHTLEALVLLIVLQGMQVAIYIDLKCFRLPNEIVLPLILLSVGYLIFSPNAMTHLLSGIIGFSICLFLALINQGGLGGGDVKFAFLIGLWLTPVGVIYALSAGFILGGIISMILIVRLLIGKKDYIPYGPYLYLGFLIVFTAKEMVVF